MVFNELHFHSHPDFEGVQEALYFFPNGYGAQICWGDPFAGDGETFEIHVLRGSIERFDVCTYNPLFPLSVLYAPKQDVEDILNDIKTFPRHETPTIRNR